MGDFQTFKIWYAKSLAQNTFGNADDNRKIQDVATPEETSVKLLSVIPTSFQKRATDQSAALAADKTSPDTGTALNNVTIRFTQQREATLIAPTILTRLINIFYLKSSDDDFQKGRIGLENTDNPELDVLPIATAGYKFLSFHQEPNDQKISLQTWELVLGFVGDHTKLGTRE